MGSSLVERIVDGRIQAGDTMEIAVRKWRQDESGRLYSGATLCVLQAHVTSEGTIEMRPCLNDPDPDPWFTLSIDELLDVPKRSTDEQLVQLEALWNLCAPRFPEHHCLGGDGRRYSIG